MDSKVEIRLDTNIEIRRKTKVEIRMETEVGHFDINGWPVHYEKWGNGDSVVLMIPGAIGTGRTDFLPQLEGPNKLDMQKYTLVAVELPGWGRSRPPKRVYDKDVYNNDADCCNQLMKLLGYSQFSIMAWSDGAKPALTMAIKYPGRVEKVIVWAVIAFFTEKHFKAVLATRNTKYWPESMKEPYIKFYGAETFQFLWETNMDFDVWKHFPGDIYMKELQKVRCPTLVIHGDKDPLVGLEQPLDICGQVPDSRLERFALGGHNLHQQFPKQFKEIVEEFLDE